jgi:hypothetical protein
MRLASPQPPRRRRSFVWPLLLAAALLLAGCPYGSEFPLGSPAGALFEVGLLGTWTPTAEGGEDFTLTIGAGGAQLVLTAESPGEEAASYPAFVSALGTERFLNLRDVGGSGLWYFANCRLDGELLRLRLVDDELFDSQVLPGAEELRAFLLLHLEDPRLYGGQGTDEWDWVLRRVEP